ncbi:MAG: STAS domain-containing protein [Pseudomonadota bacterium]
MSQRRTVKPEGHININAVPTLKRSLLALVRSGCDLTIDLSGTASLDSAGAALLVEVASAARKRRVQLSVTGCGSQPYGILQLFRLHQLLGVVPLLAVAS